PIDRITGQLLLADGKWYFRDLLGRNDSAEIRASGLWTPNGLPGPAGQPGSHLALQFTARDAPLASQLRQALPSSAQSLWANLQPRGNIDHLQVDLGYAGASGQWTLDVTAQKFPAQSPNEGRSISLEPAWFRYALNGVTGSLHYQNGRMD